MRISTTITPVCLALLLAAAAIGQIPPETADVPAFDAALPSKNVAGNIEDCPGGVCPIVPPATADLPSEEPKVPADSGTAVLSYADAHALAMRTGIPLVVYVEGDNCPPCHQMWRETMRPMLLAGDLRGCAFAVVNATRDAAMARRLSVRSTPTLVVYQMVGGVWRAARSIGVQSRSAVTRAIKQVPRQSSRKRATAARGHWTFPGDIFSHMQGAHGTDTSGMTAEQAMSLHDALHEAGRRR